MKKVAAVAVIVMTMLIIASGMLWMRGPDLSQYQHLVVPHIRSMPSENMLVVEAKGSPDIVGAKAFGLLMKTYFALKRDNKDMKMSPPRARWPVSEYVPQSQWLGRYAMPIPARVTALPHADVAQGLEMKIESWEYGDIAEILHIGPYDAETPTIEKLKKFISESGYEIAGEHEEEYLRGPGMFFKGNPDKYQTILRYPVRKRDVEAQGESINAEAQDGGNREIAREERG